MKKVSLVLDKYIESCRPEDKGMRVAAENIHLLLKSIDHESEIIPENNHDMLSRLIISLKTEELSFEEQKIINEIVTG
jgi:hypothetical protein